MQSSAVSQTLSWIAWLFSVSVESLDYSRKFGLELKPTSRSFYGLETLDVVMEDFSDMEKALKKNGLQNESELTVGDFCGAVERLQIENPEACRRLLNSWARIIVIDGKPKWRRLLFKTIGI